MAKDDKEQDNELQLEEKKGGNLKLIIIVAVVVALLVGGGVSAFFMLAPSSPPPEVADEQKAEPVKEIELGDARYVALARPFVVNLNGATRSRLMQIKVQLMVRGEENETLTKKHIPLINSALVRVFSTADPDVLGTEQGKQNLRNDALREVQLELARIEREGVVDEVLFTGFVMQ